MPKKSGIVLVTMGAVLVLAALLLFCYNQWESNRAGQASEHLMTELESILQIQTAPTISEDATESLETEPTLDPEMPVVTIDGVDYIGYLEVPDLELKLPVQSEWSYPRLQISPCREMGSTRTDDIIVAAHNYWHHFGRLKTLSEGAQVVFTDMDGIVNTYSVAQVFTLDPAESEVVYGSGYALVLYTCTPGGATRVVVFCQREDV